MNNIEGAIKNTVSISQFNRGLAGKIFEEVKKFGAKVVMKNNMAECVLMSPEEYVRIMDELADAQLTDIAEERLRNFDPDDVVPAEEVYAELGITREILDRCDEVEIE